MATFQATILTLAFCNVVVYAAAALRARGLAGSPPALRAANRMGGSLLIGARVAAVSIRHS
jgi:threonine/homoserine/homoserine lactone efflux protein